MVKLNKKLKLTFLVSWTILIFVLVTMPLPPSNVETVSYTDKIVHFFIFGIFAFLFGSYYFFYGDGIENKPANKHLSDIQILSFSIGGLYTFLSEGIQYFLPTRTVSELDLLAGVMGVLFFQLIFYVRYKER